MCYTQGVKRTSMYLSVRDRDAIAAIREAYGFRADSDTVRFALRVVVAAIEREGAVVPLGREYRASGLAAGS